MKKRVDAREALTIPTYTLTKPKKKIPKKVIVILCVVVTIFCTFYLPPMILDEPNYTYHTSINLRSIADPTAMEIAKTYQRNHVEADFDNDGLTNEEEDHYGTIRYIPDSDYDGTSDYAELYFTETNPTIADDAIIKFVSSSDARTGNSVNTPFKMNDVTMWADDYESKARGGVVPLPDSSYNIYRFTGWVQFPGNVTHAYKVVNGTQIELERKAQGDNAWRFYIDNKDVNNIRVYEGEPEGKYIVSLFGNRFSCPDNIFFGFLSFILPNNGVGIITCKPALANDFDGTWSETSIVNEKSKYSTKEYPDERFGHDQQMLTDLSDIFAEIDKGNNVIISLMSHEFGEVILEVYGYTNRNNLIVCDPQTGEDFGIINITVLPERILVYKDGQGKLEEYEHFVFDGCGYSSAALHRFVILDYVPAGESVEYTTEYESADDDADTSQVNTNTPITESNVQPNTPSEEQSQSEVSPSLPQQIQNQEAEVLPSAEQTQ